MSLATHGYQSRKWINSAARRRAFARFRAHLVRLLGWKSENPSNPYVATTGELRNWLKAETHRWDRAQNKLVRK